MKELQHQIFPPKPQNPKTPKPRKRYFLRDLIFFSTILSITKYLFSIKNFSATFIEANRFLNGKIRLSHVFCLCAAAAERICRVESRLDSTGSGSLSSIAQCVAESGPIHASPEYPNDAVEASGTVKHANGF